MDPRKESMLTDSGIHTIRQLWDTSLAGKALEGF